MDDLDPLLQAELSGSLNVRRTALAVLEAVLVRAAEWAVLVVADARSDSLVLYGGEDRRAATTVRSGPTTAALADLIPAGHPQTLRIDTSTAARETLAALVPHPDLQDEAATLAPAEVLALPLHARGDLLGALVLARRDPAEQRTRFDPVHVERLGSFAARAALALDSARIFEEHSHVTRVLEENLRPRALPTVPGVEFATTIRTAEEHLEIGGDFYDVHGSDDDWIVVLGDVCGKGVDAAVLNSRARQSIRTAARFDRSPSQILATLNDVLYDDGSDKFVTVVCVRLRPKPAGGLSATIATAGHPAPLIVRHDGTVEQPSVSGRLAGVIPHDDPYVAVDVRLAPGDAMLLFSDGIYEARGGSGLFGMDRLKDLVGRYAGAGPAAMCEAVERSVIEHLDGAAHDDMTALVLAPRRDGA